MGELADILPGAPDIEKSQRYVNLREAGAPLENGLAGTSPIASVQKNSLAPQLFARGCYFGFQSLDQITGISIFNFGTSQSVCLSASECKRPVGF